ncbi:MAG: hypothetical protein JWO67_1108 [Streptosporangiaceae bacterium]|nr:hypothetical protein [Streptosporangiaceae bacterium]
MTIATDFRACKTCGVRLIVPVSGPPLDYYPDPYGTVAARHLATGAWTARRLQQQEQPVPPEKRYAVHQCDSTGDAP